MIKLNNNILLVVAGIALILFILPSGIKESKKMVGAMTRDFSVNSVQTSLPVDITYTSSSTGFNGIEDTVPAGWTLVTQSSTVSLINNVLRVAWSGQSTTVTLQSPTIEGTYTFSGTFQGTAGVSGAISGEPSIIVKNCVPQSSKSCVGDSLYWYDSCGAQGSLFQNCGVDFDELWNPNLCENLTIVRSRIHHDLGCAVNVCFNTPSTVKETLQICTWQCSNAHCQRNTIADNDNNGTLTLSELISYAEKWVSQQGPTLSQLIAVAEVWVSSTTSPIDVPGGI